MNGNKQRNWAVFADGRVIELGPGQPVNGGVRKDSFPSEWGDFFVMRSAVRPAGVQTTAQSGVGVGVQSGVRAMGPASLLGGGASQAMPAQGSTTPDQAASHHESGPYVLRLSRDGQGRIAGREERSAQGGQAWAYEYDQAGRLARVLRNGGLAESYQYDQQGRRSHEINAFRSNLNRRFQYGHDNRLMMAGNTAYEHDQHGFRSAKREQDGRTTLYRYAPDGRLLGAELAASSHGADVVIYGHDAQGRRTAKEVNGLPVERYTWGHHSDGVPNSGLDRAIVNGTVLEFRYGAGRLPEAMLRDGAVYYLYYDQVGSLRLVADELGNAVKELVYDSFGNILEDTNPALRIPIGFAGGLHDPDTGLVRFGYRDYDPDTGRFTALDPLGYAAGDSDLYGYCLDDPVNLIDPEGLQANATEPEAYLEFDPSMEQVTFRSDNATDRYEAKNDVTGNHSPVEAGAYRPDVTPRDIGQQAPYGPGNGTYIDTGRPDGKDIHGGGSGLEDPYAPRQGWVPTHGCIRMQNEDIQDLSQKINKYKERTGKDVPFFTPMH